MTLKHGMVFVLLATILAAILAFEAPRTLGNNAELQNQLASLRAEVGRLQQEQSMPALVLNRHRDSICYIFAVYSFRRPFSEHEMLRSRISGTGFVVADGLIATNRHVAEPWYDDPDADLMRAQGARPRLEKLVAFFPTLASEVPLTVMEISRTSDVAVARFAAFKEIPPLKPLPLATRAPSPGEAVVVVGYPMGTVAMVAKSPEPVYQRLASSRDTLTIVQELATRRLVRPSATYGHLGDVVGEKLIYDAPTAHGGSGGPVFNSRGEVIAINSAYIVGFAGGTLGVSVNALKPLLEHGQTAVAQP